jgi:hypothetical protein
MYGCNWPLSGEIHFFLPVSCFPQMQIKNVRSREKLRFDFDRWQWQLRDMEKRRCSPIANLKFDLSAIRKLLTAKLSTVETIYRR